MPTATELRTSINELAAVAAGDLRSLWRSVTNADQAKEALEDLLPLLVQTYGLAASALAADWYDELRDELNIDGRFFAIVDEVDDQGADVLARWAVEPLYATEPDWNAAKVLVEGGLQRRIANASRQVVRLSSIEDPAAQGWQRSTSGGCNFCQMLASRGAVYSERSADFASHDHCGCVAVPAFNGWPKPVKPFTPSTRDVSDADRARVRRFMATHDAG